jgi:aminoglycoside/choline kinase family phosphotransferase/choline kinase
MKAMILAAGFGTRLMPYTKDTPKPLFSIAGRAALDRLIQRLQDAGSTAIIINTHHLHTAIERFLAEREYGVPVATRHEPEILGTGGALKNVADFWDHQPFVLVNSDIFTDVDLRAVYQFHLNHASPVTLVLCKDPEFNSVTIRPDHTVIDFTAADASDDAWTFTGIHVIDPEVLDLIPQGSFSSIIDIYRELMQRGETIQAYTPHDICWDDVGTPSRYTRVNRRETAKAAFERAFPGTCTEDADLVALSGDGSDRHWFRLTCRNRTMIMVDHGIRKTGRINEVDAFVQIGRHLSSKDVPLPKIYFSDTFSGLVCLQDLGDRHLQQAVLEADTAYDIAATYKKVLKEQVHMSLSGLEGFDPGWAWQTPAYDHDLILEKECRYFVECFLNLYLGMDTSYTHLADEFDFLAAQTLAASYQGFMHRDFQSRNIMLCDQRPFFIDFQGGRIGPMQYDLASLLIDPYAGLPQDLQDLLLDYYIQEMSRKKNVDRDRFLYGYACCALTRNLQMLGAFGYLARIKGKTYFEAYVPLALQSLKNNLERFFPGGSFARLNQIVEQAVLKSA